MIEFYNEKAIHTALQTRKLASSVTIAQMTIMKGQPLLSSKAIAWSLTLSVKSTNQYVKWYILLLMFCT